jgi:hypothetical protein
MPTIVPSEAVIALERMFPHAMNDQPGGSIQPSHSAKIRSLLDLVNDIPEQLIVLPPQDYAAFVQAKGTISDTLGVWTHRGAIGGMPNIDGVDVVTVLRRALVKLQDDFPAPKHVDLSFISDPDVREDLSLDVGTAERSLHAGEWKPAMIMAGAVIEDLLHWKLGQVDPAKLQVATKAPRAKGKIVPLDAWKLYSMIDVAEELGVLRNANTITSARVAKDYRNLIHPGRRSRKAERPTRARAYVAIGGMYGVIDELR